jgi:hypothetical protein
MGNIAARRGCQAPEGKHETCYLRILSILRSLIEAPLLLDFMALPTGFEPTRVYSLERPEPAIRDQAYYVELRRGDLGVTFRSVSHSPKISRIAEQPERHFDAIIRNEQLHAGPSAFHAHAYADDD